MYPEGLARFATVKFQRPDKNNYTNMMMHLTNYALNKKNPDFIFNQNQFQDAIGHKRSLTSIFKYLYSLGKDVNRIYMQIRQIIVKTIISAQPQISHIYKNCQPKEQICELCYELFGFDIILDENLRPWLLEVNHSPSLNIDSPIDQEIKKYLLMDSFNILNISTKNRRKYYENRLIIQQQGKMRSKDIKSILYLDEDEYYV